MQTASLQIIITALDKASGVLAKTGNNLSQTGAKMRSIGKGITMGVTLPLALMGAGSIKMSMDLENAFIGVRKTVDATEEELQKLKKGFNDMATRIPIATTELYGIGEAAGQLGIKTDSILHFSETMAQLGVTTNLSSQEAATSLARFANITQMPQENFDRLGATIVDLGNNLATTEAEIVAMGLRLSGAGKQVGMTEAQIMALGGALSSVGIRAEAGGTAFSKMMLNMNNSVMSGDKKLKGFAEVAGMTAEQFKKEFEADAAGAILSFIEGLGGMSDAGENLVPIMDELGLSDIRVRDALLRVSGAEGLLRDSLELGSNAWEKNTALTDEAKKKFASTGSQLRLLMNNLQQLAASFGDILAPVLLDIVKNYLMPLMNHFKNLSPTTKKVVLVILALVAALGPLLIFLGLIIPALPILGIAFAALLSPIALVIAAILAIGVAGYTMWKEWETVKFMMSMFWQEIKNTFLSAVNFITGLFLNWTAIGIIIKHWEDIAEGAEEAKKLIVEAFDSLIEWFKELPGKIWEAIKGIPEMIQNAFKLPDIQLPSISGIGQSISGAGQAVGGFFSDIGQGASDLINNYDKGGIVPGVLGAPVPAIVHGGETIIPRGEAVPTTLKNEVLTKNEFVINITGNTFMSDEDVAEGIGDLIIDKLKSQMRL